MTVVFLNAQEEETVWGHMSLTATAYMTESLSVQFHLDTKRYQDTFFLSPSLDSP